MSDLGRSTESTPNEPIDQATNLPETFNLENQHTRPPLIHLRHFPLWLKQITALLKAVGLEKLIDISTPRPKSSKANFRRWVEFSHRVRLWLMKSMSKSLCSQISKSSTVIEFADDFIGEAMALFDKFGKGIHADLYGINLILQIQSIKSMFPREASNTVWAYKDTFEILQEINVKIPPYFAFCLLLKNLNTARYQKIHDFLIKRLEKLEIKEPWKKFSCTDFHVFCFNTITLLDKEAEAHETQAQSVHPRSTPSQVSRTSSSKPIHTSNDRMRKFLGMNHVSRGPPEGVDEGEHVQALLKTLPQRLPNGKCPYCSLTHDVNQCYYLSLETRPPWFKPLPSIWAYQYAGKFKRERRWLPDSASDIGLENLKASSVVAESSDDSLPSPGNVPATLSSAHATLQKPESPAPSSVSATVKPQYDYGFDDSKVVGTVLDITKRSTATNADWLVLPDAPCHICGNPQVLVEYKDFGPEETPFEWTLDTPNGKPATCRAKGKGKAKIPLVLRDGVINEIVVDCYFQPGIRFSLFSMAKAAEDLSIFHDVASRFIFQRRKDGSSSVIDIIGMTVEENGNHFLQTKISTIKMSAVSHVLVPFD